MKEISYLKNNKNKGNSYKKPYKKKSVPKHIKKSAKAKVKNQVRNLLKLDKESLMNEEFDISNEDELMRGVFENEIENDPYYDDENKIVDYIKNPLNKDDISRLSSK